MRCVNQGGMPVTPGDKGYLVEFQRVGAYVKVSAIDPKTNTEVSMVGDPRASESDLARVAVRKLEMVLAKKAGAAGR